MGAAGGARGATAYQVLPGLHICLATDDLTESDDSTAHAVVAFVSRGDLA